MERGSRSSRRAIEALPWTESPPSSDSRAVRAAAPAGPPPARLAIWLLRPYLDLGPLVTGPLYARGIEEYWRALASLDAPGFGLQRTLPPVFRSQVVAQSGNSDFLVRDPRDLRADLRTVRWIKVCEALDGWADLRPDAKLRLARLLHALCLYETVLDAIPAQPSVGDSDIELAYWRASARYALEAPSRIADYGHADMSVFESIVLEAPEAMPAAFNAAVKVFVHRAKTGAGELETWSSHLERAAANAVTLFDPFTGDLLTSRFYRALAFLPQKLGQRSEVARLMDAAERHALRMRPASEAESLMYLENLHPLMESRAKEALWLDDRDLALARAQKVVELDPYDSKAWVELGQVRMVREEWMQAAEAYVVASMLGPPASAIGRHMAGVCFRRCGQDLIAAFFFKETLEIDPLGISPHNEIAALPDVAVLSGLKTWSLREFGY
jgi:tetratricopeptide (TPR) repeat protein